MSRGCINEAWGCWPECSGSLAVAKGRKLAPDAGCILSDMTARPARHCLLTVVALSVTIGGLSACGTQGVAEPAYCAPLRQSITDLTPTFGGPATTSAARADAQANFQRASTQATDPTVRAFLSYPHSSQILVDVWTDQLGFSQVAALNGWMPFRNAADPIIRRQCNVRVIEQG